MTCRVGSGLVAAGHEADFERHAIACAACAELGRQIDALQSLTRALSPVAVPPALQTALLDVPRQTVSCEAADELAARSLDGAIAPAEEARWKFHLSRCAGCASAAETLFATRGLTAPAAPPWLATRLAAGRPKAPAKTRRGFWGLLLSPKGAITVAYAAAFVVMMTNFNPADLARQAGVARLESATGSAVAAARASAVEKLGGVEEKAYRSLEAWKGRLVGYGRATLENALALVILHTETRRPPDRPKSGDGRGVEHSLDGVRFAATTAPVDRPITAWRT